MGRYKFTHGSSGIHISSNCIRDILLNYTAVSDGGLTPCVLQPSVMACSAAMLGSTPGCETPSTCFYCVLWLLKQQL